MAKTATEIVDYAITLMDEKVTTFQTAASTEMSLKDMGLEVLPQVCRELMKDLPTELKNLISKTASLTAITLTGGEGQSSFKKQKVVYPAPSDYWELTAIRLSVWGKVVTNYITIDSPEYVVQQNPFTRGGSYNPVVAITPAPDGTRRIECFSIRANDSTAVTVFRYIAFDNVPDDEQTTWPDELLDVTANALVARLSLIKNRLENGSLSGQEAEKLIKQHK